MKPKSVVRSKSNLNKVNYRFDALYLPCIKLKKLLESKDTTLVFSEIINALMILHYASFMIVNVYIYHKKDLTKVCEARAVIEAMFESKEFNITGTAKSLLISLIDKFGKELNTNSIELIYVCMYRAVLQNQLYQQLHDDLAINEFKGVFDISEQRKRELEEFHDLYAQHYIV